MENLPERLTHEEMREKNRQLNWQNYSEKPPQSPAPPQPQRAEEEGE